MEDRSACVSGQLYCTVFVGLSEVMLPVFSIYPNPTSERVQVTVEPIDQGSIAIIDSRGRIILNDAINANEIQWLDVSNLKSGLYAVRVQDTGGAFSTQHFVVE